MPFSLFPLFTIILMFIGAFLFFTRIYRVALAWFVRGRTSRAWESRAELVTLAASLPFGAVYGYSSIEFILLIARLLQETNLPFTVIPTIIDFLSVQKLAVVMALAVFFLAWMVPRTIASSKVFAYGIDLKTRDEP